MPRLRFSLRWMLGVVSLAAIGCGLLVYATPFLSKLAFTAALFSVIGAIPAAVFQGGQRRAFRGGFAMLGLAYLWAICGSWQTPDSSLPLRECLVTSEILARCHELLPSRQTSVVMTPPAATPYSSTYYSAPAAIDSPGYPSAMTMPPTQMSPGTGLGPGAGLAGTVVITTQVNRSDFMTAGHALFTLLAGFAGGAIARRCYLSVQSKRPAAAS